MATQADMKVLACPDAPALEGAFVERLAAALEARADPLAPITVVAPTARLLARLRVVAVRRLGAFAGVRFAHYRALAERVLLLAGEPPGALVPPAALEEIALASAREGAGPLAERAREVSALAPLLASTFRDLRDAGVTGEEAAALRREGIDGAVLAAYARFDRALEGRADAAALCRRASRAAKRGAGGLGLVLHVGVFDVVGSVAELIDAVASATPFEAIVLGVADGPAFEHGRARSPKPDAHATPRSPLAARIALLFDDRATPSPPSDAVEWIDAPGPDEELEAAARLALRWHEEGVPLEEIAILARTLEPYAPRVEATLAEHGLPFTSSATLPALRRPGARALLDLLDAVSPRPTRPGLIRLLRSPALAWAELAIAPIDFHPDRFDRLSRELAPRSVADWTEALPASAEEARAVARLEEEEEAERDVADARALAAIVRELQSAGATFATPRTWLDAVAWLRALAARFVPGALGEEELDAVAELGALDGLAPPPADAVAFAARLRRALEGARDGLRRDDAGGVRVLDLLQARGIAFRRIALLGVHDGSFPRHGGEDPLLSDAARARLAERTGRPVPRKLDAAAEERSLLALALGAATERVAILGQRSDDQGRPRSRSTFARDLGRALLGGDAARPRSLPFHPAEAALAQRDVEGIVAPRLALAAGALLSPDPIDALAAAAVDLDADSALLRSGQAQLRATDAFALGADEAASLAYDGRALPALADRPLSPTALERLGACPLRAFFHDRLRVRPLEAPEDDALVDAREIGDLVHVALERLYADLPWSRGEEPVGAAARERLAAEVAELARRLARGRLRAFPAVARALARTWGAALERFVLADVHDLAARGARSIARENAFEGLLPTSIGPIALRARIDRVVRLADGSEEVADYKTGRIGDLAKPLEAARGRRLQLALYAFAREVETGRLPRASALRIHPDATEPEIESLAPDALGGARGAIETALGVLATLSRDGVFPLASHDSACRHCRWRRACRRSHAPTRARNFAAAAHAAYVALAKATLAAAKEET